nr:hypothetical protein [Tanacetum cinerariifolium]
MYTTNENLENLKKTLDNEQKRPQTYKNGRNQEKTIEDGLNRSLKEKNGRNRPRKFEKGRNQTKAVKNGTNRTNISYIDGVAAFIDYAVHNLQKMRNIDPRDFALDIPIDGPTIVEMVNATKDNFDEDDLFKFQELLLDTEKPLYEGCTDFTKLSAIAKLLNLKGKYGCSDKFFTELLGLLKKMLPAGNEMDDKDLTACRTCRISRWKVDNKAIKCTKTFQQRITDGVLHHLADSQAWRTIDEKFPKIAEDPRNIRLGISADGVDVNKGNRHHNNVAESLFRTLLNVLGKTKDRVNARLDLAELGLKPELFAIKEIILQELDKMQAELVVTLCLLEKFFLPLFFDIMVDRELAISKESVSESVRWILYGLRAIVVKYDTYNIKGYTFRTKCHDGKVYQNSEVSVEAIDLHISKEVTTTRQAFYYGVLQEIWVLDYCFRKIPLFKYDWVNHRDGGVKRGTTLGYILVDLNNLGHKVDLFILASQVQKVFYVKD